MAKRFTDTLKWGSPWFRGLPGVGKNFWQYLCDKCDAAGIWRVDWDDVRFCLGKEADPVKLERLMAKQFILLNGGSRWFLIDFIPFQYNKTLEELDPNNTVHKGIMALLKPYGGVEELARKLRELGTIDSLSRGIDTPKDKDKAKDKDKDQEQGNLISKARPTDVEEVKRLFVSRNYLNAVNEAEKFWNHYSANGWRVGRNPMVDWKSAAANWNKNARQWSRSRVKPEPEMSAQQLSDLERKRELEGTK